MTASPRASISSFPRGHEFPPSSFSLTRDQVDAYLRAIGDTSDYGDDVPPLAVVALSLNSLQERVALPEGSLHTGQEVEHEAPVRVGEALTLHSRVAQRSGRQGFVISAIEFEVQLSGQTAVRARTTIMAPATGGEA